MNITICSSAFFRKESYKIKKELEGINKRIFLWEEPGDGLPYLEELLSLDPVVINGNIKKINESPWTSFLIELFWKKFV